MTDISNEINQKLHDRVFVLLYQREFRNDPIEILYQMNFSNDFIMVPISSTVIKLTEEILSKKEEIDKIIEAFLENWTIDRIMTSDKEVLRMAIYQLIMCKSQASSIVIDRAIRIAKKYGDKDSGKFVNGILGAVYRKYVHHDTQEQETSDTEQGD